MTSGTPALACCWIRGRAWRSFRPSSATRRGRSPWTSTPTSCPRRPARLPTVSSRSWRASLDLVVAARAAGELAGEVGVALGADAQGVLARGLRLRGASGGFRLRHRGHKGDGDEGEDPEDRPKDEPPAAAAALARGDDGADDRTAEPDDEKRHAAPPLLGQ